MKSFTIFLVTAICITSLSSGCKKASTENTRPQVFSGYYQTIYLPEDSVILKGDAYDMQNNIEKTIWQKLAGPSVYSFDDSTSLTTAVRSLHAGTYMFQLTVIDKMGFAANDTTYVLVFQRGNGTDEHIFENLEWNCSMGCWVVIDNIYGSTPVAISKVFVRKSDTSPWEPAVPDADFTGDEPYSYGGMGTDLVIYSNDATGTVDVKVVF